MLWVTALLVSDLPSGSNLRASRSFTRRIRPAGFYCELTVQSLRACGGLWHSPISNLWETAIILMGERKDKSGDLVQGTLDMLVLKALAGGSKHGYAVAEWIHETSEDVLRVEEGALYPALHRLELKGLLKSEWGTSENNRRAKYYALTAAGRKYLAEERDHWGRMSAAIARVLQSA
jgi:PadR family transcriptional regulator